MVERDITTDINGDGLPRKWFDGVYMEPGSGQHNDDHMRKLLHSERNAGVIMINSAETVLDDHENDGGGSGEVLVIMTNPFLKDNEVVQNRVLVGPRPVHSYAVYPREEFWTHSDGDGQFYVIKLSDATKHTGKPIIAKVEDANHGKLLWDESEHLESHGYATSTGERVMFILDMEEHEMIGTYDYTQDIILKYPNYCMGTHAIAYSSVNRHVYLECVAGGGVLEIDVNDPENPKFVKQHEEVTGSLYEIPDGSAVVASDKGASKLHVLKPGAKGVASSIDFQVEVPGHPSTPSFYPIDEEGSSYIACMPLTENTNINHRKDGENVCDIYQCGGASTPQDVASGICLYDPTNPLNLLIAPLEEIESVKSGLNPYNEACNRCKEPGNYEDGKCVCTPYCGSCAESNYDDSFSGVQCVNLDNVFNNGLDEATLVAGAGAVFQAGPQSYSPQCGFGRTYRAHKRGGKYDASIADIPVSSLQIVNMETQKLKCQVDLPGNPDRVIYVPPQPGQDASGINENLLENALTAGEVAGVVVGSLVVVAFLACIINKYCCRGAPQNSGQEVKHEMQINNDLT